MTDISAILTCHREGLLLGPAIASLREAIQYASQKGASVEAVVVIDCGDLITRSVVENLDTSVFRTIMTATGDPGQARNAAVLAADGQYVAFLDGDDLWSFNWLSEALHFSRRHDRPIICHSEANLVFGAARQLWWHVDSESPEFDSDYLLIGNYWDAMCFAPRRILAEHPFKANDLASGFGHEDWHWNCITLENGIPHRPVPGTVHFKRRRKGSQMAKCEDRDVVAYPTKIAKFS